ncbi:MAG: carboxypeptidase M32 [Pseudomonadota bacterium]
MRTDQAATSEPVDGEAAYRELCERARRVYRLRHVQAISTWDRMTKMPPGAAKARAQAQAALEGLILEIEERDDPDLLLRRATAATPEGETNLALMRRDRALRKNFTEEDAQELARLSRESHDAWMRARQDNDWSVFAPAFGRLLAFKKDRAERLGRAMGLTAYDVMLDEHDRGLTTQHVKTMFASVVHWLPELRRKARASVPGTGPDEWLSRPVEAQERLCRHVMSALGFDFDRGRFDESVHPFTGGVPEDVRVTTRYEENDWTSALKGVVHETGHALYQGHLPEDHRGLPVGEPCSAAVHEAQAILYERQLLPRRSTLTWLCGELSDGAPGEGEVSFERLHRHFRRVTDGRVRVAADEVSYGLHIILRTDVELALFEDRLEATDVPDFWRERVRELFGHEPGEQAEDGPMQDIHWSHGMFGYFPSYLYGSIIAAQLFSTFLKDHASFDVDASEGRFGALSDWLETRVWSQGARYTTAQLVERATGRPLDDAAYRSHLEMRFLKEDRI